MMTSSKTTLALLIYGLLVQCNVCSPLNHPNIRYGNCTSVSANARRSRRSCGFRIVQLDGETEFLAIKAVKKNADTRFIDKCHTFSTNLVLLAKHSWK